MRNFSCVIAILSSVVAAACGAAPPEEKADPEKAGPQETGTATQPIANGWVIDENYSGLVKLTVYSPTNQVDIVYCSGTLMANNWIFTAGHCFDDIDGRRPSIQMGSQVRRAASVWRTNATDDLALVTLESPMDMWNWTGASFATNPPQYNNWQYSRRIAASNAAVHNTPVACSGSHRDLGQLSAPTKVGFMKSMWLTEGFANPNVLHMFINPTFNQWHEAGDSGGGCLTDFFMGTSPIAITATRTFVPAADFDEGAGPSAMTGLLWAVMLGAPPAIVY